MKRLLVFFVSLAAFLSANLAVDLSHAAWFEFPLNNPGAETGDVTGWINQDFHAENDPGNAHQGNWYFAPDNFDEDYLNRVEMRQEVDLSPYAPSNIEFSFCGKVHGRRWGYDAESDQEYLYDLVGVIGITFYNAGMPQSSRGQFVSGEGWQCVTLSTTDAWFHEQWEASDKQDIDVRFNLYYYPVNYSNQPWAGEIEEWRDWVNGAPFAGFDSARLRIEGTPTGACCLPDGSCVVATEENCAGEFKGEGIDCASVFCPNGGAECACDLNTDGKCNQKDLALLSEHPDLNGDGKHDSTDSQIFADDWLKPQCRFGLCICELIPDATELHWGDTLSFDAYVTNLTDRRGLINFGTKVKFPSGAQTDYVWGPFRFGLDPHETKSEHKRHTVPSNIEFGEYQYTGEVKVDGLGPIAKCEFPFRVVKDISFTYPTDIDSTIRIRDNTEVCVQTNFQADACTLNFAGSRYEMTENALGLWTYNVDNLNNGIYYYYVTCSDTTSRENHDSSMAWTEILMPECNNNGICDGTEDIESCPKDCYISGSIIQDLLDWNSFQNYTLRELEWQETDRYVNNGVLVIKGDWSSGWFTGYNNQSQQYVDFVLYQRAAIYLPEDIDSLPSTKGLVMSVHKDDFIGATDALSNIVRTYNICVLKHGQIHSDLIDNDLQGRDMMTKQSFISAITLNNCELQDPISGNFILYLGKTAVLAGTLLDRILEQEGSDLSSLAVIGASKEGYSTWLMSSVDDRVRLAAPCSFPMQDFVKSFGMFSKNSGCGDDRPDDTSYINCIRDGAGSMSIEESQKFAQWLANTTVGQEWNNLMSPSEQMSIFYPSLLYFDGDDYACPGHEANFYTVGMENSFLETIGIDYRYYRGSLDDYLSGIPNVIERERVYNIGKIINDDYQFLSYPNIISATVSDNGGTEFEITATITNSPDVVNLRYATISDRQIDLPENRGSWVTAPMTFQANNQWVSGTKTVPSGKVIVWYVQAFDNTKIAGHVTRRMDSSPVEFLFPTPERNCPVTTPGVCSNQQSFGS